MGPGDGAERMNVHPLLFSDAAKSAGVDLGEAAASGAAAEQTAILAEHFIQIPKRSETQRAQTAALNDAARADIAGKCRVIVSPEFAAKFGSEQDRILEMIRDYNAFDPGITVFDERDFGVVYKLHDGSWSNQTPDGDWSHQVIFWQLDYCDPAYTRPSFETWDETRSARALILMIPDEFY